MTKSKPEFVKPDPLIMPPESNFVGKACPICEVRFQAGDEVQLITLGAVIPEGEEGVRAVLLAIRDGGKFGLRNACVHYACEPAPERRIVVPGGRVAQ